MVLCYSCPSKGIQWNWALERDQSEPTRMDVFWKPLEKEYSLFKKKKAAEETLFFFLFDLVRWGCEAYKFCSHLVIKKNVTLRMSQYSETHIARRIVKTGGGVT